MKKFTIAFLFALIAASATAMAYTQKDTTLTACTTDHVKAVSHIILIQDVAEPVETEIKAAFAKVGSKLDFETLTSQVGFKAFAAELTDEDKAAFLAIYQPSNEGECK